MIDRLTWPQRRVLIGLLFLAASPVGAAEPQAPDIPPMVRKMTTFDVGLLAPVEGVTMRQIGQASYYFGFVPMLTKAQVLDEVGIDPAHYDAAQKVFTQRMIADKTLTLIALFGAYADEVARGRFAAYAHDVARSVLAGSGPLREPMPMPEAKFEEIQSFYARKAGTTGVKPADLDLILAPTGLTYNDFQILSGWYGRRIALQIEREDAGLPPGASDPVADAKPPEPPRPALGGMWHIAWTLLRRGDTGMDIVQQSRDVCIKAEMTAADLPLMPQRGRAKCAMRPLALYDTGIRVGAQCDQGDFGSAWSLSLEPIDKGPHYKGEIQFTMQTEGIASGVAPNASTPVTADRVGDCR